MTPLVYVIMPVGSDPNYPLRRARIEAAVEARGMDAFFPLDHRPHSQPFDDETIRAEVRRCDVAVADLTLGRPSCYYELGIAHGLGVPAVVMAESGTHIHQLANRRSMFVYKTLDELESKLTRALRPYSELVRHR
ncbi:MAG TPA: hypothetical protein VKB69_05520 [Micromonosporaceae bacterium]|nr:hypothetical protein [Micromonosporaceae bacterium]